MFNYFLLLVNFADYEQCHEAKAALSQLRMELPRLYNHLKTHTSAVEFQRDEQTGSGDGNALSWLPFTAPPEIIVTQRMT